MKVVPLLLLICFARALTALPACHPLATKSSLTPMLIVTLFSETFPRITRVFDADFNLNTTSFILAVSGVVLATK